MQTLDATLDQLRHRRASLPEHQQLTDLATEAGVVADKMRDARIAVDDFTQEQSKAEADVEQARARRERDRGRMDSGAITNPKDLQNLSHELESLERRISSLEDTELDVMERLEEAQRALDQLQAQDAEIGNRRDKLEASRDEQVQSIDAQSERTAAGRDALVAQLPQDLLALYEKLRAAKGGVGAALLRARQCGGCMLTLDAAELSVFRAAAEDEVLRCEECQRILIRTDESGL